MPATIKDIAKKVGVNPSTVSRVINGTASISEETRQKIKDAMKELADMVQRVEAAKMLLSGNTYEQIVKNVEISTATISRINRCIQYGSGGYEKILNRAEKASKIKG